MSWPRDHRIRAVRVTLLRAVWMGVNVRDNADTSLLAHVPKCAEIAAVESHDASVQALGIQVVVENELSDPRTGILAIPEQKRSALSLAVEAPLSQRRQKLFPEAA